MRYRELLNETPEIGDILGIEAGDTLIEATIQDLRPDGVVIQLDEAAINLLMEARDAPNRNNPKQSANPGALSAIPPRARQGRLFTTPRLGRRAPRFDPTLVPTGGIQGEPILRPDTRPGQIGQKSIGRKPSDWYTPGELDIPNRPELLVPYSELEKAMAAKKKELEVPVSPAPLVTPPAPPERRAPPTEFISMRECENSLQWGIETVNSFSEELKNRIHSIGEGAAVEYLVLLARRTNAFRKFNFTEKQLRYCQDYLSYEYPGVESWDGLLEKTVHENYSAMDEAEYQGREVPLGKPMKGDVKKSKVYVKGPKGNVVKVNFGDPNMRIKKSSPKHRKSFRARHHCENPGPRWKARFWSCRMW